MNAVRSLPLRPHHVVRADEETALCIISAAIDVVPATENDDSSSCGVWGTCTAAGDSSRWV